MSSAFVVLPAQKTVNCISLANYQQQLSSPTSLYSSSFDDEEEEDAGPPKPPLPSIEKAWRHAKKPLLRIGGKGATKSHGNSLRQLLDDHTVVKVKVNTQKYGKEMTIFC